MVSLRAYELILFRAIDTGKTRHTSDMAHTHLERYRQRAGAKEGGS